MCVNQNWDKVVKEGCEFVSTLKTFSFNTSLPINHEMYLHITYLCLIGMKLLRQLLSISRALDLHLQYIR